VNGIIHNMPAKIEISLKTLVTVTLACAGIVLLGKTFDILIQLFIAVILMAALNPIVDKLEKFKLPRPLAILVVYILLWGFVVTVFANLVPDLLEQSTRLIRQIPNSINQINFFTTHQQEISQEIMNQLGSLPQDIIKFSVSVFSNALNVLTTLVITFYLLLDHNRLNQYLSNFLSPKHSGTALSIINNIESKLGSWIRGELILMSTIGLFTYIGLSVLGLDNALPLAILAGLLEIIPNIGPIISAIPAVLVALNINPLVSLAVIALYILVHFSENHFLVPQIMKKAVGIHPLISIFSLMVGLRLIGPTGAILAIPFVIVIRIVISETHLLNHLNTLRK
jgi:predicted PurR-regulated permease PerM